jgi:hypothetical protein
VSTELHKNPTADLACPSLSPQTHPTYHTFVHEATSAGPCFDLIVHLKSHAHIILPFLPIGTFKEPRRHKTAAPDLRPSFRLPRINNIPLSIKYFGTQNTPQSRLRTLLVTE